MNQKAQPLASNPFAHETPDEPSTSLTPRTDDLKARLRKDYTPGSLKTFIHAEKLQANTFDHLRHMLAIKAVNRTKDELLAEMDAYLEERFESARAEIMALELELADRLEQDGSALTSYMTDSHLRREGLVA